MTDIEKIIYAAMVSGGKSQGLAVFDAPPATPPANAYAKLEAIESEPVDRCSRDYKLTVSLFSTAGNKEDIFAIRRKIDYIAANSLSGLSSETERIAFVKNGKTMFSQDTAANGLRWQLASVQYLIKVSQNQLSPYNN